MKIIFILHIYVFFRILIQRALSIIVTVSFLTKVKKLPQKNIFVLSIDLIFQGSSNLRLGKIKQDNSDNS